MGILNLTPDSFHDGNKYNTLDRALNRVNDMLEEGANIIDMGAMSSRPGASIINTETEQTRLLPVLREVRKQFPDCILSVDTIYASTARVALDLGCSIINDISAGYYDERMLSTVAEYNAPYVAMHMRGTPENMGTVTDYKDLVPEIMDYFIERIFKATELGIKDIVLDPGFGFSKTVEQNFELLNRLEEFQILDSPVLVGISRKSMIWRTLSTDPAGALNGTTALHAAALLNGADILRVHDVRQAKEVCLLFKKLRASS